ncbi:MAG: Flp pilus assembly protein CpaB [Rhodobacteraceae bacterium]|nr:Flp pilus assembly protein CpaB [Paracoccaceae bacterium]
MRAVFGLVLIVGIALAGGAVMLAKNYIAEYQSALDNEKSKHKEVIPTVMVYVADRTLRYGEQLTKDSVRQVMWPQVSLPEGAFTKLEVLFPVDADKNRVVLRPMEKDEAILAIKVTEPGEDAGLTSQLEPGMRAFAIRVDVASGVSGFLRPGDRVDVYWTGSLRGTSESNRGEITRLIESAVPLIAIDQSVGGNLEGALIARTVTVSANQSQVAALVQAQSTGRLSLALVGVGDETIASVIEIDQNSLLGISEEERAPAKVEQKVCTIRTRRGAEVMNIPIPCSE